MGPDSWDHGDRGDRREPEREPEKGTRPVDEMCPLDYLEGQKAALPLSSNFGCRSLCWVVLGHGRFAQFTSSFK